jgi:hydroxymethylpyrimidine pyrophosphatase-like HAD family hydrolase
MKIVFDIDGTICEEHPTFEKCMASVIPGALEMVNKCYDIGDTIIFYTGRGWAEYNMTKDWLDRNGFKYHQLICGKPLYDIWYDDRSKIPNYLKNDIL